MRSIIIKIEKSRDRVGDLVSVYRPIPRIGKSQKLLAFWRLGYKITEILPDNLSSRVEHCGTGETLVVNVNNVKPFFERPGYLINESEVVENLQNEQLDESLQIQGVPDIMSNDCIASKNRDLNISEKINDVGVLDDSELNISPSPNNFRRSSRQRLTPKHFENFHLY